jgi:hypothetical protein
MRSRCGLGVLIAIAVASLGGYALARTAGRTAGASSGAGQLRDINAAIAAVAHLDPGCNTLVEAGISQGTPTTLLPLLGVLRRHPRQRPVSRSLLAFGQDAGSVYVNYLHPSRVAFGQTYYVVPLLRGAPVAAPTRCISEQKRELRSRLRALPVTLRRSTLSLGARAFSRERRVRQPEEVIALMQSAGSSGDRGSSAETACCATAAAIAAGRGAGATLGPVLSFVVPDGVATVTLSGAPPHHRIQTITTRPVGNVVVVYRPVRIRTARQVTEIWRSADGAIIKTLTTR